MRPKIVETKFGSITVDGKIYHHDIIIKLNGKIEKRKSNLSRAVYGSSHIVSLDEAKEIYDKGACCLIVGSGQFGQLKLSEDAIRFFREQQCEIKIKPTPNAIEEWNTYSEKVIGLFHVTC